MLPKDARRTDRRKYLLHPRLFHQRCRRLLLHPLPLFRRRRRRRLLVSPRLFSDRVAVRSCLVIRRSSFLLQLIRPASIPARPASNPVRQMRGFVLPTRRFVLPTRRFVLPTRRFVLPTQRFVRTKPGFDRRRRRRRNSATPELSLGGCVVNSFSVYNLLFFVFV